MKAKKKAILLTSGILALAAAAAAFLLVPRRELTTSSDRARAEYLAGMEDMGRMYLTDAASRFEASLRQDPSFVMAMVSLASLKDSDDPDGARELLRRAMKFRNRITRRERLVLDLAIATMDRRTDEARRIARTLKADYHEPRAYVYLAADAARNGKSAEAESIYREWIAADPNSALAYNTLGYMAAYRGDFRSAVVNLKKYAFMAPDEANPFDSLGEISCASGDYDAAIASLRHAIQIKPDFAAPYEHLGLAYSGKGDYVRARQSYEKAYAMQTSPGQKLRVALDLFLLAQRQRDPKFAQEIVDRVEAIGKEPATSSAILLEAYELSSEGRYREALARLSQFSPPAIGDPQEAESYRRGIQLLRGRIEFNAGHFREAAALLEPNLPALEKVQSIPDLLYGMRYRALLARSLARMGQIERAERLLAVNQRLNPHLPETVEAAAEVSRLGAKAAS